MIQDLLTTKAIEAVKQLFDVEIGTELVTIQRTIPNFREQGDFSLVVFPLVKILKKSPEELARQIGEHIVANTSEVESYSVVKGFLNLRIVNTFWLQFLKNTFTLENFGKHDAGNSAPIVVEFSSPNTNKPLHLGHIRNNLLGYSISKILEAAGNNVVKVNLVNDRGIHISKSMLAWKLFGNNASPESTGKKGDKLVGDFYVLFDKKLKEEIATLKSRGMTEDEANAHSSLMAAARDLLVKWENHDEETWAIWTMMNNWVYKGFDLTYKRLGVEFEKTYHESETYLLGKSIVEEGLQKGVLYKKADNSIWIDLTQEGLDEKLLLRADGTSVYMTQDLGTAQLRYDDYNPTGLIYVVGNEQNYHFDVLKLVLKKLGKKWAEKIFHLSYGMVELPEGKMKSREGTVVDADDLIDEMVSTAKEMTIELGKIEDFESEEANELYRVVGLGALKYFILKVDPKKNMMFNPKESIDFNGNTGPFIQYTHARIKSVLRKAERVEVSFTINMISHPKETSLMILNYLFPQIVSQAANEYSPSVIANYLYELAKEYNQFYHELSILKEEDNEKKNLRLALSMMTSNVLRTGMKLLGIDVPEKM